MTADVPDRVLQPYLHELVTAVRAPAVALSAASGDIVSGVHGFYWSDRRALSRLSITVDGHPPEPVHHALRSADRVTFCGVVRHLGDNGADPTVLLSRDRRLGAAGLVEIVSVTSRARQAVEGTVEVAALSDLAAMHEAKAGVTGCVNLPATVTADGVSWQASDGTAVRLSTVPAPAMSHEGHLELPFRIAPGERFDVELRLEVTSEPHPPVVLPGSAASAVQREARLQVDSDDVRLTALVERSIADLEGLTVCDPIQPDDRFLAAGAPWFLTLFGRDALWAARMLLPLGTELAAGTLRALARRQGRRVDAATAEQPGKIMHEIRPQEHVHSGPGAMRLPPLYYGTVDATAIFVSLLHDAWRWGLAPEEVDALLPAAQRAVRWLTDYALAPSGFVSYRDETGHGLANQGWKDSGDSVQFADGRLAQPPIALCEVQAYAVAAAHHAASLFDAFGRGGADQLRDWADALTARFRRSFWVSDPEGDYPAIALDGAGQRVDSITSNLGHLLGTGLLDEAEEELVVARLSAPDMDCGFGLRTMSSRSRGFNPLAYHGGSVWTHDTAIAISGLAASRAKNAPDVASSLIRGLLAAAPAFDFRMPELFGGVARDDTPTPLPYPAACRPQAWAATASVAMLGAVLGIEADVPAGRLSTRPLSPSPVGRLAVRGLAVGDERFGATYEDGAVVLTSVPSAIRVVDEARG